LDRAGLSSFETRDADGVLLARTVAMDPYRDLGGEAGVRRLVECFYDRMESSPEAELIRSMHAPDLGEMRERLSLFLCGWLGGPQLHTERYGPLCMRSAHAPFPIGSEASDQWVACMTDALEGAEIDDELRAALVAAFARTASMLINRSD
jgi:hemoglobin